MLNGRAGAKGPEIDDTAQDAGFERCSIRLNHRLFARYLTHSTTQSIVRSKNLTGVTRKHEKPKSLDIRVRVLIVSVLFING